MKEKYQNILLFLSIMGAYALLWSISSFETMAYAALTYIVFRVSFNNTLK